MSELETGGFQPLIDDSHLTDRSAARRIVLCSGKVYYDLEAEREERKVTDVALVRLEQFYPFPAKRLAELFASYPNAAEIFWTQEEPMNMGGWTFVEPRLKALLPSGVELRYVGRAASASPATGSYAIHNLEQKKLIDDSLASTARESSRAV